MTVLALQASPYAAAVLCAWLSTRPERPEPGVAPLPAVTPTTAILPARPAAATESTARPPVAMPGPVGPGWRTVPLQRTALPMAGSRDRTAGVGPR
jgi:hypothetical protein